MLREHRYKAIAITGSHRSPSLPDVPTVAESGLPAFEATAWTALLAPAGTPSEVIKKINASINDWIKSDDGRNQLAKLDMTAEGGSPADLDAFVAAEIAKWGPIIKASGITVQ
jgi:tripartite-type tricarboxylate transporter receptor subunit TctC